MSVIPTRAAEHRHVPMSWAVGHCVLGFFILKGRQINLYPEASYNPPWSATLLRNPHLVWMLWTSFTLSIQTVSSWRGWASWRFPRNPWGSLLPMPPSTLAPIVSECSINWLCSPYHNFVLALHWRLLRSPASTLDVIGHSWSLGGLCLYLWFPWPSCLHFLLYHSLDNGMATLLHSFYQSYYLCGSPSPIEWAS